MCEVIWKVKITGNRIAIRLIVQFMYCMHHCIKCSCSMIAVYLDLYPAVVLLKVTNLFSDMSYVAVCEANRHVYIYRQPVALATELRNRRTGQHVARTAKQQLVNLDSVSEVLGVHASCNMLYVLTVDTLYALRVSYGSSAES